MERQKLTADAAALSKRLRKAETRLLRLPLHLTLRKPKNSATLPQEIERKQAQSLVNTSAPQRAIPELAPEQITGYLTLYDKFVDGSEGTGLMPLTTLHSILSNSDLPPQHLLQIW